MASGGEPSSGGGSVMAASLQEKKRIPVVRNNHRRQGQGQERTNNNNDYRGDRDSRDIREPRENNGSGSSRDPRDPNPKNNGSGSRDSRDPKDKGRNHYQQQRNLPPRLKKPSLVPSTEEPGDNCCVVCYKEVKYYSVGACNHSVCHECSARMRVLMEQNECPICRKKLENVVFTKGLKTYKELKDKLRMFIFLPQFGLYLEDEEVNTVFEKLLEHRCEHCKPDQRLFRDFKELKTHLQREHDLFACDLCAEYIKLFSKERKFYTRSDLAHHKRKGDRNDTSHRGHPICQFCDKRYFDQDELYKHLRKDHYFCHFCDADGFNHYYNTYDDLRIHFRREHFLCEEEHCKDEQFTSVFRSEIDIKAHLTSVHSRLLGKHGTKQTRVLDLEFCIKSDDERKSRRFNGDGFVGGGGGRGERYHRGHRERDRDVEEEEEDNQPYFEPTIHEKPKVDSVADFPLLEGANAPTLLPVTNGNSHAASSIAQKLALSAGKNVATKSKPAPSNAPGGPRWNAKVTGSSRHDEEFPALGGGGRRPQSAASVNNTPYVIPASSTRPPISSSSSGQINKRPPIPNSYAATEEFPSLGNPSGNGSAWMSSGAKMKNKSRMLKVAPPPLERKIEVHESDEFHFVPLSVSRARKDSLTKKYENFIIDEDEDEEERAERRKKKKAKENRDNTSRNNAKAAAALFNGGKAPTKDKSNKGNNSSNGANKSDPSKSSKLEDDFPSLAPLKKTIDEPKTNANPNIAGITISSSGPPPGFSARPNSDDIDFVFLTSTSSSSSLTTLGNTNNNNNTIANKALYSTNVQKAAQSKRETESLELLKAKAGAKGKVHIQPPEFGKRNQRLMEAVKSSLNGDEGSFELFRSVSNQYKKGEIESTEYYELCQDMFGVTDFRIIFPELVALLPHIEKQQELLLSHKRAGGQLSGLTSCYECYQVIKSGDMSAHMQSHASGEVFPALNS